MEIKPDDYILGYWFASNDNDDANWYMMIWKSEGKWYGQYTFRYHKDSDPFSGKDEKSVYSIKYGDDETEESILKNMNVFFEIIKQRFKDFSDSFMVRGTFKKFRQIAQTKHYLHIKEVKGDEVDKYK